MIVVPIAASATFFFAGCSGSSSDDPGAPDGSSSGEDAPSSGDGAAPAQDGGDGGDGASSASLPTGLRDRVGRPYVSLLLVSAANREYYNGYPVEDVFPDNPDVDGGTSFGADFQSGLVALDKLDGVDDWEGGSPDAGPNANGIYPHPLEDQWLSTDALLVDPNKPFSTTSYLDIEAHAANANTTCGGRWPGEDALDKTMSFVVKKTLTGVTDGVSAPAKAPTQTFPYLAEPF